MDVQKLRSLLYQPKWYIQYGYLVMGAFIACATIMMLLVTASINGGGYLLIALAILFASFAGAQIGHLAQYELDAAKDGKTHVWHAIEQWITEQYTIRYTKPIDEGDVEAWLDRLEDGMTERIQTVLTDGSVYQYGVTVHDGKLLLHDLPENPSLASLRKQ